MMSPGAIQGGANVQILEGDRHAGHRHIEIGNLEAVDLDFERQRMPDEGSDGSSGTGSTRHLDNGASHRQRLDPEFVLQELAQIPVQHGLPTVTSTSLSCQPTPGRSSHT